METRTGTTNFQPVATETQPATTEIKPSVVTTQTETSRTRLSTIETRSDLISTRTTTVTSRVKTTESPSRTPIPPIEDATTKQGLKPDQRVVEPAVRTTDSTTTVVPPQTPPAITREPLSKAMEVKPDNKTSPPVPTESSSSPSQYVDDTINTTKATNATTSAIIYDTSPFSVKPIVSLFCKVFMIILSQGDSAFRSDEDRRP